MVLICYDLWRIITKGFVSKPTKGIFLPVKNECIIQFWDDHNNWFGLEDGWSLSLSYSFNEAWVYPFDDGFFYGPEYQLMRINGKWLFTGESKFYTD